jgi:ribosomal protein S18 acetylase RimI-like enzyme
VRPNNALFSTGAITVRKALLSDHQSLTEADECAQTDRTRAAYIKDCLVAGECLIGEIGTEVFGFVVLNYSFFNCGFVPLIVVAERFRRQGLGSRLLTEAAERCESSKLFISANASNKAAKALFAKAGFVQSGSIENLNDGEPELIYFESV